MLDKPNPLSDTTCADESGLHVPQDVPEKGKSAPPDLDLAAPVQAWPTMPEHLKAAIKALVESARQKPS